MYKYALLFFLGMTACKADETISGSTNAADVWQLVEMNGTPIDIPVTLSFPEEGQLAGSAPCNRYFASQNAPLPWFETGPIGATKRACPELDLEFEYFQTLQKMRFSERLGKKLILSNEAGEALQFTLRD